MTDPDYEFHVRDDGQSISYGPGHTGDDPWILGVITDDGERVELRLDEQAMYELWIEVKDQPWPDALRSDPEDALHVIVAEAASALGENEVYDILERGLER